MSLVNRSPYIAAPVGSAGAPNDANDVAKVQYLFNIIAPLGTKPAPENGVCSPTLLNSIKHFQHSVTGVPHPDGRIDPQGPTLRHLLEKALALRRTRKDLGPFPPTDKTSQRAQADNYLYLAAMTLAQRTVGHSTAMSSSSSSSGVRGTLTDKDFVAAAAALNPKVSPALLHAFARVESGGKSGMDPKGRAIIAFEGHRFRTYTAVKTGKPPITVHPYDTTYPLLSYPYVEKAGPEWQKNNADQDTAWATLDKALALDNHAALMACSWGMFQVMGFNYKICGYATIDAFVTDMKASERCQLDAFVGFCKKTAGMVNAMVGKDFAGMASRYNGDDYGNYDKLIAKHYKEYGGT